jgi:hypothetical protein
LPDIRGQKFLRSLSGAVSICGLVQNVLSAVLIFLLLLGIRNLLKLK